MLGSCLCDFEFNFPMPEGSNNRTKNTNQYILLHAVNISSEQFFFSLSYLFEIRNSKSKKKRFGWQTSLYYTSFAAFWYTKFKSSNWYCILDRFLVFFSSFHVFFFSCWIYGKGHVRQEEMVSYRLLVGIRCSVFFAIIFFCVCPLFQPFTHSNIL